LTPDGRAALLDRVPSADAPLADEFRRAARGGCHGGHRARHRRADHAYAAAPPRHVAIRELPWLKLTSRLSLAVRRSAGSRLTGDVARWIEDAAAEVSSPG